MLMSEGGQQMISGTDVDEANPQRNTSRSEKYKGGGGGEGGVGEREKYRYTTTSPPPSPQKKYISLLVVLLQTADPETGETST